MDPWPDQFKTKINDTKRIRSHKDIVSNEKIILRKGCVGIT